MGSGIGLAFALGRALHFARALASVVALALGLALSYAWCWGRSKLCGAGKVVQPRNVESALMSTLMYTT